MRIDDKKCPEAISQRVFLPGVDYERIVKKPWQMS